MLLAHHITEVSRCLHAPSTASASRPRSPSARTLSSRWSITTGHAGRSGGQGHFNRSGGNWAGLRLQPEGAGTCRDGWGHGWGRCRQRLSDLVWASRTAAPAALGPQPLRSSSQAARSAGPLKSSSASARASSCSSGRACMRAMVASLREPQRRLSRRRVTTASPS